MDVVTTMATQKKLQRRPLLVTSASPHPDPDLSLPPLLLLAPPSPPRVAVVGGGVIGLSTALRLAEKGRRTRRRRRRALDLRLCPRL